MLNKEQNVQECDARKLNSISEAGNITIKPANKYSSIE